MEGFIILLIGAIIFYTLISGLRAIVIAWKYCITIGSSAKFIPIVFNASGGNLWIILGLIILCIPVWILLSIIISIKK